MNRETVIQAYGDKYNPEISIDVVCKTMKKSWWDGGQVASTLMTRLLNQFMPDKDNFGAVISTSKRRSRK